MSWALLDEISLSGWQTPVAYRADLVGLTLWLEGKNFVAGTTVQLNDRTPLPASIRDAEHLQVTLPAALTPGLYDVTLAAPDGRAGATPILLRIGRQGYLPAITR